MQYNSPLPKQMRSHNQVKLFEMFIYASKIVPRDAQTNESKFEEIELQYWGSHMQRGISRFLLKKL